MGMKKKHSSFVIHGFNREECSERETYLVGTTIYALRFTSKSHEILKK